MLYVCSICKSEFKTDTEALECEKTHNGESKAIDLVFKKGTELDTEDKKHCIKCKKMLKESKEIKIKHRILFGGRYCLPCSIELEKEILNVLSEYNSLISGYIHLNEIIQTIISLKNNPNELKDYLKSLMIALKKKDSTILKKNIRIN